MYCLFSIKCILPCRDLSEPQLESCGLQLFSVFKVNTTEIDGSTDPSSYCGAVVANMVALYHSEHTSQHTACAEACHRQASARSEASAAKGRTCLLLL